MSLFPDPPVSIEPAADRPEPVLWVRRLVILPSLAADALPIREVEFRLGLNIIRTADRPTGEDRVIGHSVGKTLLTRLIRYCLGETHFAVEAVRNRIISLVPTGYAVVEVFLAGNPWVVVRPLRGSQTADSWAAPNGNWQIARSKPENAITFSEFVDRLEALVAGPIPDLPLAHASRGVRWLDLLGWLARDHECGYRVFNEWREPDADSGTGKLHREDASFLLRLAMGLVDPDERRLIEAHRGLLADQDRTRTTAGRLKRSLEGSLPMLCDQLGLSDEECTDEERVVGGLFATKAREVVNEKTKSLQRLSAELKSDSQLETLYEESIKTSQDYAVKREAVQRTEGLKLQAEAELKQRQEASSTVYYETFSSARNCPSSHCPLRPGPDDSGQPDPERKARIAELIERIAQHDEELGSLRGEISSLQEASETARAEYHREQERVTKNLRGVSERIGRWNLLVEQAGQYEASLKELRRSQERSKKLERQCEESLSKLEAARGHQAALLVRLSDYFDWTLKQLVGPTASGTIACDARGLQPMPGNSVAASGSALSTLANVIGLDLACLAGSICGLGYHPRFVIHDGPRAVEMESVLFNHIFNLIYDLESAFPDGRQPGFQYIITTSSPIPDGFQAEPFTRIVLDARDEAGLLLAMRF